MTKRANSSYFTYLTVHKYSVVTSHKISDKFPENDIYFRSYIDLKRAKMKILLI